MVNVVLETVKISKDKPVQFWIQSNMTKFFFVLISSFDYAFNFSLFLFVFPLTLFVILLPKHSTKMIATAAPTSGGEVSSSNLQVLYFPMASSNFPAVPTCPRRCYYFTLPAGLIW